MEQKIIRKMIQKITQRAVPEKKKIKDMNRVPFSSHTTLQHLYSYGFQLKLGIKQKYSSIVTKNK